jgi:hypothetical protein
VTPQARRPATAIAAEKATCPVERPHHIRMAAIDMNDLGRYWWHLLGAQDPELVFNAAGKITPEIERRELAPHGLAHEDVAVRMELEEGKLYDVDDRMEYVRKILDQYHDLMTEGRDHKGQYRPYMIQQMQTIAGWKGA